MSVSDSKTTSLRVKADSTRTGFISSLKTSAGFNWFTILLKMRCKTLLEAVTVDRQCCHDKGICIESTADKYLNMLRLSTDTYDLVRWDENEIVTAPYDYECARYVIKKGSSSISLEQMAEKRVDLNRMDIR